MALAGRPWVSVWIRQPGRVELGVATLKVVSEPKFRRFYKMILKLFVNDFENCLWHGLHLHIKDDKTLTRILWVLIEESWMVQVPKGS